MEENQQNQNRNEKPRYYATDFNEIKENLSDEEKLLFERYKEMLSGIIPADSASSAPANDAPSSSSSPSNDAASFKALLNQLKDISQKTMKLMARGKLDIPVTCPKCGKRHCFIKVDNGLTHCWSCNWSGYLEEMKSLLGKGSGKVNGNYYANAQKKQQDEHKAKDYVPMLPDDFLEIDAETRSWLYPIYPFRTQEEQQHFIDHFHPANLLSRHPKARPLITAPELASLQSMVQRYIQAMKLSPDIIVQEGVMCAWMKQNADDLRIPLRAEHRQRRQHQHRRESRGFRRLDSAGGRNHHLRRYRPTGPPTGKTPDRTIPDPRQGYHAAAGQEGHQRGI